MCAVQWPKPNTPGSSKAILDLISRALDGAEAASSFTVYIDPTLAEDGKDVFILSPGQETESIEISASSGVAAAMGFNYYLKYVANSSGRICESIQRRASSCVPW